MWFSVGCQQSCFMPTSVPAERNYYTCIQPGLVSGLYILCLSAMIHDVSHYDCLSGEAVSWKVSQDRVLGRNSIVPWIVLCLFSFRKKKNYNAIHSIVMCNALT